MNATMPYSGFHGDEDWLSDADQAALEEHCKSVAWENLRDAAWWECETGEDEIGAAVGSCLARCMVNLNNACSGDSISMTAITTALSNLQHVAKDRAFKDAMDEA